MYVCRCKSVTSIFGKIYISNLKEYLKAISSAYIYNFHVCMYVCACVLACVYVCMYFSKLLRIAFWLSVASHALSATFQISKLQEKDLIC